VDVAPAGDVHEGSLTAAVTAALAGFQIDHLGAGCGRNLVQLLFADVLNVELDIGAADADYSESRFFLPFFDLASLTHKDGCAHEFLRLF
jgi:hypothetical protein